MRNCFLIVLATLVLSGNLLFGQTVSFDQKIRICYLNLDTSGGNKMLLERYPTGSPEYMRLSALREFLGNLLHQSKKDIESYFTQSGDWIGRLEKSPHPESFVQAAVAEIHLYRAVLASQMSDYKSSAAGLIAAYKIVARYGPALDASDRNKLSGILGILLKQVPDQYARYLRLLGVRTSGLSGLNGLERYYGAAAPGSAERIEGYLLLITAKKEFSQDPAAAWSFVQSEGKPLLTNPLVRYQSALAALKAGDCRLAGELLDAGPVAGPTDPFPYWTYQRGRIQLYQGDPAASGTLERFIDGPGGDNYVHNALLMQGWSYLLEGKDDRTRRCFARIRSLPAPLTIYDKQALNEAGADALPDVEILKTRLLFDGGDYGQCLTMCVKFIQSDRFGDRGEGELYYRKARCEQRLGRTGQAIKSFLEVIDRADAIGTYIVPNSALQAGHLYNKSGQTELARKYYKICLDLNQYGYRDGISRQAQSALRELDN